MPVFMITIFLSALAAGYLGFGIYAILQPKPSPSIASLRLSASLFMFLLTIYHIVNNFT